MKTKTLNGILDTVSEVCEVSREELLSRCKRQEVVDARCIFVHFCKQYGFPSKVIADFLGRQRACVVDNYAHNYHYFSRVSYIMRVYSQQVSDKLSVILPDTHS